MMWRHQFQVSGTSPFPLDMLRYDECFPAIETEMHEIVWTLTYADEKGLGVTTITLVHYDERAKWEPTVGRWQSFGWQVVDYVPGARGVRREKR